MTEQADDPAKKPTVITAHTLLIGALMSVIGGVGNFVGTHWGGVTNDQLVQSEARIAKKIEPIASDVTTLKADSDNLKKYVDSQMSASEKRMHDEINAKRKRLRGAAGTVEGNRGE